MTDLPVVRFQSPQMPPLTAVQRYYSAAEDRRWFSNNGPCLQLLESRMTELVGSEARCLGTSNATAALVVALRHLVPEVAPSRDLVVMPAYTFAATATAATWSGLRPLLVDVDPGTWQMDPAALEAVLDRRSAEIAVVMGCSTFGTPAPPSYRRRWTAACRGAGVPLLIDSAAGLGATDVQGGAPGPQGDVEVFSMHATKPFGIGEGGLIVTTDERRETELRRLVNFGFDAARDLPGRPGTNAKMSELHAAMALAVLDTYPSVLAGRRRRADRMLSDLEPLGFVRQEGAEGSTVQFLSVQAPSAATRDAVLTSAALNGVEVRAYYDAPLHRLTAYRESERHGALSTSSALSSRSLSLPMSNDLSDSDMDRVVAVCRQGVMSAGSRAREVHAGVD